MTQQHPHAELSAYIDGALDTAAGAAVDGHLVTCALCRSHVAQLRATAALVKALPDPIPSRRLVPRFAAAPAWLAPLRTLMTLASGAAVFLFVASALVTNITFLASSAAAPAAQEAGRDTATRVAVPPAAQPAATGAFGPAGTPDAKFAISPTASPAPRAAQGAVSTDNVVAPGDQPSAAPSGGPDVAFSSAQTGRIAASEPQRSPLLNPWLWLALALICGAIAIALSRRLRASA